MRRLLPGSLGRLLVTLALLLALIEVGFGGTKTWDGKYDTQKIKVRVVYFVPADRGPLPDWQVRARYYCRRMELFHRREFGDQSELQVQLHPEPVRSGRTTAQLRDGDANAIFFRTLRETHEQLNFGERTDDAFPILLVLSEINWRPLNDFYRLKPDGNRLVFEGNYSQGQHFPGAAAGGARATYLSDRGLGWGLVSADGWRVPYRGSDCVLYHEGVGHTVGLPHPRDGNGSVMSLGQYRGWISESWLDRDQKMRLGWKAEPSPKDPQLELFSAFRAIPEPTVPRPGQEVVLKLDWPDGGEVETLTLRCQTRLRGPWVEVPQIKSSVAPTTASLGTFDRPTPVSYRIDATLKDGSSVELWGYFQVRARPDQPPQPMLRSGDLDIARDAGGTLQPGVEEDLLAQLKLDDSWQNGEWKREGNKLVSPKQYGARIELPYRPKNEYRLTAIVEPLDPPDGLILGQCTPQGRFVALVNYTPEEIGLTALENVAGKNVGNSTTVRRELLKKDRLSQIIVTVLKDRVTVSVDGTSIIDWQGSPDQLTLSDYWSTPQKDALFLGAYNCRYRFHRLSVQPLTP